jgi:hypothetical protein
MLHAPRDFVLRHNSPRQKHADDRQESHSLQPICMIRGKNAAFNTNIHQGIKV